MILWQVNLTVKLYNFWLVHIIINIIEDTIFVQSKITNFLLTDKLVGNFIFIELCIFWIIFSIGLNKLKQSCWRCATKNF